jgi:hypothetical protein
MKILLTNVYDLYNKGEVALVTSLVKNLPNSEVMIAPLYSFINREVCALYPHHRFFSGLIYYYKGLHAF